MNRYCGIRRKGIAVAVALLVLVVSATGCMVGPNYHAPAAPVADNYLDPGSDAIKREPADLANWWTVFNDPTLNQLVQMAFEHNPTLQTAAVRVLEAQARRGVAVGLLFPQQQQAFGGYSHTQLSKNESNIGANTDRSYDDFQLGAAASWELDFWGRYRRAIESNDANILSAEANYDDVLVSLIGDVATEYISIRIAQEQLAVVRANVELQKLGLQLAEDRFKGGTATDLDRTQATVLLRDTEAQLHSLEATIAQGRSRLFVLLGIPPKDLTGVLGDELKIPAAPASVAIGIPADLLRRRRDIRRVERDLAAQSARIGIAKSDLYPAFSLVGDIRLASEDFGNLFKGSSLQAFGGPNFRWNLFNYGRIENLVRIEDARFQEQVGVYENTVLNAQSEVESFIAGYLGAQREVVPLTDSVAAAKRAVDVADTQYRGGVADYTRVLLAQQFLLNSQSRLVSARGSVALNLVSLYRALGGGWELRDKRQPPIDEKIREEMRSRTNWGKLLQ
jgi:NodT family efflux transporter outer membrane factor (OMF) lipoprotein